jgi:hypothetical protein
MLPTVPADSLIGLIVLGLMGSGALVLIGIAVWLTLSERK